VAVDAEADRAAATRAFETHRHFTSSERYSARDRHRMLLSALASMLHVSAVSEKKPLKTL